MTWLMAYAEVSPSKWPKPRLLGTLVWDARIAMSTNRNGDLKLLVVLSFDRHGRRSRNWRRDMLSEFRINRMNVFLNYATQSINGKIIQVAGIKGSGS